MRLQNCEKFSLSECNNSAPNGRIFMKFDISVLFEIRVEKIQFLLKSDKHNGTLHKIQYTVLIYLAQFLEWELF